MAKSASVICDTLAAARRLTDTGLSEARAEALVNGQIKLLESDLATKDDLEKFRAEIDANFARLGAENNEFHSEMQASFDKVVAKTAMWVAGLPVGISAVWAGILALLLQL